MENGNIDIPLKKDVYNTVFENYKNMKFKKEVFLAKLIKEKKNLAKTFIFSFFATSVILIFFLQSIYVSENIFMNTASLIISITLSSISYRRFKQEGIDKAIDVTRKQIKEIEEKMYNIEN